MDRYIAPKSPNSYYSPSIKQQHIKYMSCLKDNGLIYHIQINKAIQICKILRYRPTKYQGTGLQNTKVQAFPSNHMAGSIMILILLEGKYYLHTGDMRFNRTLAKRLTGLFQQIPLKHENAIRQSHENAIRQSHEYGVQQQSNTSSTLSLNKLTNQNTNKNLKMNTSESQCQYKCKYAIQELHLDNTFCDPIFKFPSRSFALRLVVQIIKETSPLKVFLCTDSVGKEEAFILLSQYYNTKILVSSDRMEYIEQMDIAHQRYFIERSEVNEDDSWIEVIRKGESKEKIEQYSRRVGKAIAITLTGWANLHDYHPISYNSYIVPYSLHSNYYELELFVSWVIPHKLIPIVKESDHKSTHFKDVINTYQSYMYSLTFMKQRGFDFLVKRYQRINTEHLLQSTNQRQLQQQSQQFQQQPIQHNHTKNRSKEHSENQQ